MNDTPKSQSRQMGFWCLKTALFYYQTLVETLTGAMLLVARKLAMTGSSFAIISCPLAAKLG
jgi:hypothetical protein